MPINATDLLDCCERMASQTRWTRRSRVLLRALLVVTALAVAESTLQIVSALLPRPDDPLIGPIRPNKVSLPDPELGHRPNPAYILHDRLGYRNASVPERIDIIALGDSQTYGTGVPREAAWPQQLEEISGAAVYQMAFGSWGPVQFLTLFQQAAELRPKLVIAAFYFGNDLFDSWHGVYKQGIHPALMAEDPSVLRAIAAAEEQDPLYPRLAEANRVRTRRHLPEEVHDRAALFLASPCKVCGVLREATYAVAEPAHNETFDDGKLQTVLTPFLRLTALDDSDPRIREGFRISLAALEQVADRAREK
ncbi:MAG: SGNH/GDSL hydrolase family protein, partial [bacterium]